MRRASNMAAGGGGRGVGWGRGEPARVRAGECSASVPAWARGRIGVPARAPGSAFSSGRCADRRVSKYKLARARAAAARRAAPRPLPSARRDPDPIRSDPVRSLPAARRSPSPPRLPPPRAPRAPRAHLPAWRAQSGRARARAKRECAREFFERFPARGCHPGSEGGPPRSHGGNTPEEPRHTRGKTRADRDRTRNERAAESSHSSISDPEPHTPTISENTFKMI